MLGRMSEAHDVLVLGGGTAGCVLAARLSEDPGTAVALVEAGPDYGPREQGGWPPEMLDAHAVPFTHDWGYDGEVGVERARIIGGCSSHNACIVLRGSPADYDEWGEAGAQGWSASTLEPHLRRAEAQISTRRPDDVELAPWHRMVIEACAEAGVPVLDDLDDPREPIGVGRLPLNTIAGVRENSAFAYLDPARDRPNLKVLDDHLVDRVRLSGGRAVGAVVVTPQGPVEIHAERVVLAAGAYGSPEILMRSGVGPPRMLSEHSIPVEVPLEGVGAGLIDHAGASVYLQPGEELRAASERQREAGPVSPSLCAVKARSRGGPDSGWDLHLLVWAAPTDDPAFPGGLEVHFSAFALKPTSRGRVRLRSRDPRVRASIEQGFLSDPEGHDVGVIGDGIALARRICASEPVRSAVDGEVLPGAEVEGPALEAYIRGSVRGYFHPVGTCRMGSAGNPSAVCDASGGVHGVEGLHVADASIMPTIPSANTNLTTLAIAEKIGAHLA